MSVSPHFQTLALIGLRASLEGGGRDFPTVALMDSARSVEVTGRMRKGVETSKTELRVGCFGSPTLGQSGVILDHILMN